MGARSFSGEAGGNLAAVPSGAGRCYPFLVVRSSDVPAQYLLRRDIVLIDGD
jgi:hypothetical protein